VPLIVDPCAGEGEAASMLLEHFGSASLHLVEMEHHRAMAAQDRVGWSHTVGEGDFFQLHAPLKDQNSGADIMYLNPPYDTDKELTRLEERFLQRAIPMIKFGGLLVFVVPHASLSASAKSLSLNFRNITCFRFPEDEWHFKQVVLFANRVPSMTSDLIDLSTVAKIQGWAKDPFSLDILGSVPQEPYRVGGQGKTTGFRTWEILPIDIVALGKEYRPWESTAGPIAGISPPSDAYAMMGKKYPLASRPRAVHLSSALSAGVFNGVKVMPDKADFSLPPILIKGVFDKEYRKIEEKENKEGMVIAEVQVQQPKLVVTLLDITTGMFHDVAASARSSEELDISKMTMKDLLDYYGQDLMKGMLDACPVLHDPSNDPNPIPMSGKIARPLFPAQVEAVRTVIKLQEAYPDRGSIILGEIGCGKTSVALGSLATLGKKRALVVCPPHLLDSWKNEIKAVLPSYKVLLLENIPDVQTFVDYKEECIAILSREKAKLSHGWEGIKTKKCPKCNGFVDSREHGKKRSRCDHYIGPRVPKNAGARWLLSALPLFLPYMPDHSMARLIEAPYYKKRVAKWSKNPMKFEGVTDAMRNKFKELVPIMAPDAYEIRAWMAWADPTMALELAQGIPMASGGWDAVSVTRKHVEVLLPLPVEDVKDFYDNAPTRHTPYSSYYYTPLSAKEAHARVHKGGPSYDYGVRLIDDVLMRALPGTHTFNIPIGSLEAIKHLFDLILEACTFKKRKICNEPWYYAVGPSRYALATWIQKRAPDCYDMLILDEAHEFSGRDSAQTSAAQKLMTSKVPVLLLTGSLLNGYAESVYMNMYGVSPEFRQKFGRNSVAAFVDRYGYWKQIAQDKDFEGKIVEFGSNSDRVIRSVRKAGVAPGILPLFQLEYILPCSVTLQKEDLGLGIPPCNENVVRLDAKGDLFSNYEILLKALKEEIKRTRFEPGLAGKLWGAFAHMPSYLDLACVGNSKDGKSFEVRWPENAPGYEGLVIASVPVLDPSLRLPKEKYLLDAIQEEVSAGRNVMVMAWHLKLIPRLEEIISQAGFKTIVLDAAKVSTAKRQEWIEKKVVTPKVQVMICNPMVIQTGLNNLVHFGTEIWVENPSCNAIIYRQACGRIDRIGQTVPSNIVFPIYGNTAQHQQHRLLMHKVGVSKSVDGLDPEEALNSWVSQ